MGKNLLLTNLSENYDFSNTKDFMINEIKQLFSSYEATGRRINEILFIPYAFDGVGQLQYINNVRELFPDKRLRLITNSFNPLDAISGAQAICVGGGNLNYLKNSISEPMLDKLNEKIEDGIPYIGWNEGAILACPTHIDDYAAAETFINAVPFQIFCHYNDTFLNQVKIKTFLNANASRIFPITQVICFSDAGPIEVPIEGDQGQGDLMDNDEKKDAEDGGSGIRIEESNAGLAGTERSPAIVIYQLENGNLVAIDQTNVNNCI